MSQLLSPAPALTVRQAASRIVARHVRELVRYEKGARTGNTEAIHQMRVQTRRLRAALELFAVVLRIDKHAGRARLRWLGRALGRVRDVDVIATLLEERHLPHLAGVEATRLEDLVAALKERRWRAHRKLKAVLARRRYARLKQALLDQAKRPRFRRSGDEDAMAARLLADRILREARRVSAHRGMTEREPEAAALHALRITIKGLRYALEFHAEAAGLAFEQERHLTRDLQDCLGGIHDHDLLLSWFGGAADAAATPVEAQLFAGAWQVLPERLAADRARLFRRFLRLRGRWRKRTEPAGTVAPLEEPRFVALEAAPVQLRLAPPQKTVASLRIVR